MEQSRKSLSSQGLLNITKQHFSSVKEEKSFTPRTKSPISLSDCLMSALAVFSLKFPSLLKFDTAHKQEPTLQHNLRQLYQVSHVPSDTYMRERLDEVSPFELRQVYKKIFTQAQRGKLLEPFEYLNGAYLVPVDGTGFFSSNTVNCENCCTKKHNKCHLKIVDFYPDESEYKKNTYFIIENDRMSGRRLLFVNSTKEIQELDIQEIDGLDKVLCHIDMYHVHKGRKKELLKILSEHYSTKNEESISYYHNMLCGAIVHPDLKTVLPFAPEPILNTDGSKKNDCEHNAMKRFLSDFRREHPHLKTIIVQDSIASNYPNLQYIQQSKMNFIVGVKPGDHKFLFETVQNTKCFEYSYLTEDGIEHRYKYLNSVSLNKSHPEFKVNFMEYWSKNKHGKKLHFCWVTDIQIEDNNCYDIMRGGRANWKIENNVFNTLKNQGYQFEHNFGHGSKNLSSIFGMLMVLAFFIDQVQEQSCKMWKKARAAYTSRSGLFDKVRNLFMAYLINSWDDLYNAISHGHNSTPLSPNTS